MAALLDELREHYDLVLLDTPPLLPVTDAAAVAPATDGALLVCNFKRTTREQLASATAALDAVSTPLLGTVFTMVPSSGPRAYAQYNAYYKTATPVSPPIGNPAVNASSRSSSERSPSRDTAARRPRPSAQHRPN